MSDQSPSPTSRAPLVQLSEPQKTAKEHTTEVSWFELGPLEELTEDGLYGYEIELAEGAHPVLIAQREGARYALHDECPHRHVKLSTEGYLEDDRVVCGFHRWSFHLDTGAHMIPTGICVATYQLKEEGGSLWVALPLSA